MRSAPLAGLAALLALSACLDRGEYPSLRPRAFEVAGGAGAPLPPAPPAAPARPEIVARVAVLVARAEEGQRAFVRELAAARPVLARAGAADSETWIRAQEQLSALDASREPTVSAMADIDGLTLAGADPAGGPLGENDLAAIGVGGDRTAALLAGQHRQIADLAATLATP